MISSNIFLELVVSIVINIISEVYHYSFSLFIKVIISLVITLHIYFLKIFKFTNLFYSYPLCILKELDQ